MATKKTAKKGKRTKKNVDGNGKDGPWVHNSRKDFENLRNLPRKQRKKGGMLDYRKGEIATRPGSQSMMMWDVAMDCLKEDCPFHNKCSFVKKGTEKCTAQVEYVNIVYMAMMDRFDVAKITDEQIIKIGMQIIPLYTQLFKMKMIEYGLDYRGVVNEGKGGSLSIHPVYKEIRELMKTINSVWKSVGNENIRINRKGSKDISKDVDGYGDTAFYKMMMEGESIEHGNPQWEEEIPEEGEGLDFESDDTPNKKTKKTKKSDSEESEESEESKKPKKPKKKKKYSRSSKKVQTYVPVRKNTGLNCPRYRDEYGNKDEE